MESQARELLAAAAERHCVPGAQLGLLRGAERLVVSHGTCQVGLDRPVTSATRFHAGSLAKALAAQLVLEAAARGELDLDAPCSSQADLEWDDTPRTLLSQTSGRPNELPEADEPLNDFCARVAEMDRVHPTGRFSYCNAGWSALDMVLMQRSGAGFAERVVERFGGHLGMPEGAAEAHGVSADGTLVAVPPTYAPAAAAAGALWWASADELLDLAARQLHPEGWGDDPALLGSMQAPVVAVPGATVGDAWGYGWMVWHQPRAFGWAGFTSGHRAYLRCFPDQDAALVLLANSAGPLFGPPGGSALFDGLVNDLMELLGVPPAQGPPATPARFAPSALPGQYGPLVVSSSDRGLLLDGRALGGSEHQLSRPYGDTWVIEGAPPGSIPLAFSAEDGATVPAYLYLGPMAMPRVG